MVRNPVVGAISQTLWSFHSASQGYLQTAAGLEASEMMSQCQLIFTEHS